MICVPHSINTSRPIRAARSRGVVNPSRPSSARIVVIGAGAFGGWTALHLQRCGVETFLLDGFGPGNSRASSGGETRIIRGSYGGHALHTSLALRSLEMWHQYQADLSEPLFFESGVLWLFQHDDAFVVDSLAQLEDLGHPVERLSPAQAENRFGDICFDGIRSVYYEPTGGYLAARQSCQQVVRSFLDCGGTLIREFAVAPETSKTRLPALQLLEGSFLEADRFVFACGPWLPALFPDLLSRFFTITRQEVFFFGAPPGLQRVPSQYPVVLGLGEHRLYSVPASALHDFKIGDDTRGDAFDPTTSDRMPSPHILERIRAWMDSRFPAMRGASVTGSRVCQYSQTKDGGFVAGVHPGLKNVWLLGGGSGHGFKMGPAIGELVSRSILEDTPIPPEMALSRCL